MYPPTRNGTEARSPQMFGEMQRIPVGNALCGIPGGGEDYACTLRLERHGGTFPTDWLGGCYAPCAMGRVRRSRWHRGVIGGRGFHRVQGKALTPGQ